MAYNHRKLSKKADDTPKQYEGQLQDYNDDLGETVEASPESVQGLLRSTRGEGQGENLDVVTDIQLDEERDNDGKTAETIEAQFDKRKSYQPHRDSQADDAPMMPINALSEGYDQTHRKAFNARQSKLDSQKRVVDKDIGKQLSGPRTKQPRQVPTSGTQLVNHPDRLASGNQKKMALAALKDADAVLFYLHYKAASENRPLTEREKKIESQIAIDKRTILSQFQDQDFDEQGNPIAQPADQQANAGAGVPESVIIDDLLGDQSIAGDMGLGDMDMIEQGDPRFKDIHHREQAEIDAERNGFEYLD